MFALVSVVPFDEKAAEAYGRMRADLRRRGQPIGEMDTLIAATAVADRAVLITQNLRHSGSVPELVVEDWS